MMPNCRETTQAVTDAREGKLSGWARVRYVIHLGMCHHCRRFVRQLDTTTAELGTLREDEVPAPTKSALLEQFRKRPR